jgi:hypothetical protein
VRLKCRTYTLDPARVGGDGVYSVAEWGAARRAAELAELYDEPTDDNYRNVLNRNPEKVEAARQVCQHLDFDTIRSIGEMGGAPYIQALEIASTFPNLRYLATDHDEESNGVLARVPLLSGLTIRTFSATDGDLSIFDECDWLISFAVDYALTDDALMRILKYVRDTGKIWALFSVSIIGVAKYLRLHAGFAQRRLRRIPQRFHGWSRSVDWYREAARSAGLRLDSRGQIGPYELLWITTRAAR